MTPRMLLLLPSLALMSCGSVDEEKEEVNCNAVQCEPCASPLSLRLKVPNGQPSPEATLEGVQGSCGDDGFGTTVCFVSELRSGTFEFDVQATGYQKAHVREEVLKAGGDSCCHCDFVGRWVEVQLTPL